jgi:uncharacterized protein with HEPN domain
MQPRDVRHWLWDVRESCDVILEATRGLSFEEFVADRIRRSAVEREFEILTEALKRTLALEAGLSLRFPDFRGIVDFRNILAHGYHAVKYEKVWPIVVQDVPVLRKTADDILKERTPHQP